MLTFLSCVLSVTAEARLARDLAKWIRVAEEFQFGMFGDVEIWQ